MTGPIWKIPYTQPDFRLLEDAGISPLLARILASRGLTDPDEVRRLLASGPELLHDPMAMLGMARACERVRKAIVSREQVTVYGDYDVDGITATGTQARVGAIAVDPKVIPYGTRMFIVSEDGKYIYGEATAEDCGGLIKGNRIDLYFDTLRECNTFGVRMCQVYFLI